MGKAISVVATGALLVALFGGTALAGAAGLIGTDGDDRLVGTDAGDAIAALGGRDTVDARGGDDLVLGVAGTTEGWTAPPSSAIRQTTRRTPPWTGTTP